MHKSLDYLDYYVSRFKKNLLVGINCKAFLQEGWYFVSAFSSQCWNFVWVELVRVLCMPSQSL